MTVELSHANGRLDNLGHDMDTRRFRNITDLKETKVLLNTLFFKVAHEKVMEKRALDQKVTAQEQELADLRAKLSQYEPQVPPPTCKWISLHFTVTDSFCSDKETTSGYRDRFRISCGSAERKGNTKRTNDPEEISCTGSSDQDSQWMHEGTSRY